MADVLPLDAQVRSVKEGDILDFGGLITVKILTTGGRTTVRWTAPKSLKPQHFKRDDLLPERRAG